MFDSGDSAVFWLNVTNLSLGLAVLGFLVLVLYSAMRDIWSAVRTRASTAARMFSVGESVKKEN